MNTHPLRPQEREVCIRWDAETKTITLSDYREATRKTLEAAGYPYDQAHLLQDVVIGWTWRNIPAEFLKLLSQRISIARRGRITPETTKIKGNENR